MKKQFLLLCFLILSGFSAKASPALLSPDEMTLSREQTDKFASLWVNYHGRICPLQTLAIDFTTKLHGKPYYKYANAEQVLLGWVFFPDKWQFIPLFDVKHPELKKLINSSGKASFTDFFQPDDSYKLGVYWKDMYSTDHPTPLAKEAIKLDEKIQLITMLQHGSLLKILPYQTPEGQIRWLAPSEKFPQHPDNEKKLFATQFFPKYYGAILDGKSEETLSLIEQLRDFQQKSAGKALPSEMHLNAELINNRVNIFSWLFKINLTIGCIGMFLFLFYTTKEKNIKRVQSIFYYFLILVFLAATTGIGLRGYISGRLPMSNGYETMLFVAWCSLLVGLILKKYPFLTLNFSFLLSGFTLLVAHIGSMNPQITPLMPVLQSPLLSVHVSLIMLAYGLCGFMFFNSLTSLGLLVFLRNRSKTMQQVKTMKEMSELFMFPATFLMGIGIFIGAIWANVSWGRYWGWDPKEVWALITFLLMCFTFHGKTLTFFKKPVYYHLFILIIFASVLMTYFGVNYMLGGRHSYAGG